MTLPFEAGCLPVAPLTLPYADHGAAWAAISRWTPLVAVWPLLSGERPWELAAAGLPGLVAGVPLIDRAQFDAALEAHQLAFLRNELEAAALPAFARQLEAAAGAAEPADERALILALWGPVSLGLALADQDERPLLGNEASREVVAQHLRLRAGWLEQAAGDLGAATVVCFDEPFWNALAAPFLAYDEAQAQLLVEECFGSVQGARGLQASGEIDWLPLLESSLSLLICQPAQRAALLGCGRALNAYFERGGIVAWALVPGDPAARGAASAEALKAEWDGLVRAALDADVLTSRLLVGSLLTIGSELASAAPADADAALELLAHVARAVRAHYKLS